MALDIFFKMREHISDLKACIIENDTNVDFVTSDDPAVIINRFYAQKVKSQSHAFGSAGAILILPLSPKFLLFCYDGDVYNLEGKFGNFVKMDRINDINFLNNLQYLKAEKTYTLSHGKTATQFAIIV